MQHTLSNTATGDPAGTFAYAAPEMLMGEKWDDKVTTSALVTSDYFLSLVFIDVFSCQRHGSCKILIWILHSYGIFLEPVPCHRFCCTFSVDVLLLKTAPFDLPEIM